MSRVLAVKHDETFIGPFLLHGWDSDNERDVSKGWLVDSSKKAEPWKKRKIHGMGGALLWHTLTLEVRLADFTVNLLQPLSASKTEAQPQA